MTLGEFRNTTKHLPDWTPVLGWCRMVLQLEGPTEGTVSGADDGTPCIFLHLDSSVIKELGRALK